MQDRPGRVHHVVGLVRPGTMQTTITRLKDVFRASFCLPVEHPADHGCGAPGRHRLPTACPALIRPRPVHLLSAALA